MSVNSVSSLSNIFLAGATPFRSVLSALKNHDFLKFPKKHIFLFLFCLLLIQQQRQSLLMAAILFWLNSEFRFLARPSRFLARLSPARSYLGLASVVTTLSSFQFSILFSFLHYVPIYSVLHPILIQ